MIDTFAIRCSILQLALSGKLSEQKESDGTAKDLLSRITRNNIDQEVGVPYQIPESWSWGKVGDIYKINPKVEADDNVDAAFIPMDKISAGFDRSFTYETQRWEKASKNHTKFQDEDVAFAKITPCFENRKSFIARDLPNGIGGGTTELIILRQKEMFPEYTYLLILDQRFINTGTASYKGSVGQQRVQSDVIKNYLIPVPPLTEQQRIVERVQRAFSALDIIDELQTKYADNLTVLKSKLIDAAIQGKLTAQLPEDGTAEELYRQIQEQKQALVKAGKIKKEKPLPEITEGEKPFEIPENWKWVRFSDLYSLSNGIASRGTQGGKPYPVLRLADLTSGNINTENIRNIDLLDDEFSTHKVQSGDLIFIRVNGSRDKVANAFLYTGDLDVSYCDHLFCGHKTSSLFDAAYVMIVYQSNMTKAQLDPEIKTTAGQNTISQKSMAKMLVPLPPLAEQKRIVNRLEELLPLCEKLK